MKSRGSLGSITHAMLRNCCISRSTRVALVGLGLQACERSSRENYPFGLTRMIHLVGLYLSYKERIRIADSKQIPGQLKPGRTNLQREDSGVLIEKEQKLLPVNGLSAAMLTKGRRVVRATRAGRRLGKKKGQGTPVLPPRLEIVNTVDAILRFTWSNSAASVAITRKNIFGAIGGIVTVANTTVALLASSFRLRKITIWSTVGSSTLFDVIITSGAEQALSKDSVKNSDLPVGTTTLKPIVWAPKRSTYLANWQSFSDSTDQLFSLTGASGGVIDVHLTYTIAGSQGIAPNTATTTSTVAVGVFGAFALDNSNKAPRVGPTALLW